MWPFSTKKTRAARQQRIETKQNAKTERVALRSDARAKSGRSAGQDVADVAEAGLNAAAGFASGFGFGPMTDLLSGAPDGDPALDSAPVVEEEDKSLIESISDATGIPEDGVKAGGVVAALAGVTKLLGLW